MGGFWASSNTEDDEVRALPTISANDCGCCVEEKALTEVKLLVVHPLITSHNRDQGESKKSLMVIMVWYCNCQEYALVLGLSRGKKQGFCQLRRLGKVDLLGAQNSQAF